MTGRSTSDRGLGWSHQRGRAQAPKPQGDPCPYCRRPMWPDMELDWDHATPRAFGGDGSDCRWAHARCNRRAGGRMAKLFRRSASQRLPVPNQRRWV